nr:orotidine-5'-phosphate decarboxylase [Maliibacterium massiliense]
MMMDKLYESVAQRGVVCVGLDTDYSYLPEALQGAYQQEGEAIFAFNRRIIDATLDVAGCYKVQIAYYESLGMQGLEAYRNTLAYLRAHGAPVIADIKRGDIAKTAEMYAKAHFEGDFEADFVTLSPYMGMDSIAPYLPYVQHQGKGMFVLVRTSNPGAKDFQYVTDNAGTPFYDIVGRRVQQLGVDHMGACGYSAIGAVIGGTHAEEAVSIRKALDKTFFLIPGYGAQGAKASDIALYLKDGNGGVVNASRSVLLAYRKAGDEARFEDASRAEVLRMRKEIADACAL